MNVMAMATLLETSPDQGSDVVEAESVVPHAPWVYGLTALVILLVLLLVVTRLDLDR